MNISFTNKNEEEQIHSNYKAPKQVRQQSFDDLYPYFKNKLKTIFIYYCSFGDKQNYQFLKIQNYQRLLQDLQLIQQQKTQQRHYDIIFCQGNHSQQEQFHPQIKHKNVNTNNKCLTYQQFLKKIPKIAIYKYSQEDETFNSKANTKFVENTALKEAEKINKLLTIHFQPLYEYLMKSTEFGQQISHFQREYFTEKCFKELKHYEQDLFTLYKEYFSKRQQARNSQDQFKILSKMAREINFVNKIVSKGVNFLLFEFLLNIESKNINIRLFQNKEEEEENEKKIGYKYQFTFFLFLQYLTIFSRINSKYREGHNFTEIKIIYKILEIIQLSKGYQILCKKVKPKKCLLLTEAELVQIESQYKNTTQKTNDNFMTEDNFESPFKTSIKKQFLSLESPLKKDLGQFYESLKLKFIKLCSKKHVESNFYLQYLPTKKLMQTIRPQLSNSSINILLASINGGNKLNFQMFIKLLKKLSQKCLIKIQNLYNQVLKYNTGDFNISLIFQNMILDEKQYQKCKKALKIVDNYLNTIFQFYSSYHQEQSRIVIHKNTEESNAINLLLYTKILQDLDICPNILSSSELADIFEECSNQVLPEKMTFQEFKNSLILIILSVSFDNDLEGVERLIYLLEKMSTSKKGESLMKKNKLLMKEDPLYMLKIQFKDVYSQLEHKLMNNNLQSSQSIYKQSQLIIEQ